MPNSLLSLCIPTYNRSRYLQTCIESIVTTNRPYLNAVEVVISDNASTDDTADVVAAYQAKYNNIRYFRNPTNVHDRNFPEVIGRATGTYRKLLNDTSQLRHGAVNYLLHAVEANIERRPVLFFSNVSHDEIASRTAKSYHTVSDFVAHVSYFSSWIGSYGMWEDDFLQLDDMYAGCDTRLWQTKHLLAQISSKHHVLIYPWHFTSVQKVVGKNVGYGVYQTYLSNYMSLLLTYRYSGELPPWLIEKEKRNLLFGYFADHILNMVVTPWRYCWTGWRGIGLLVSSYRSHGYFYLLPVVLIKKLVERLARQIRRRIQQNQGPSIESRSLSR